jgi:hypothetical protein
MSFKQMYRHTDTHTDTHTTHLIPMPHAVGFCMDINTGNAPPTETPIMSDILNTVEFVWRGQKHGWDSQCIITEAGLTNISHFFLVMMNGVHLC